jgi:hypothetical protein
MSSRKKDKGIKNERKSQKDWMPYPLSLCCGSPRMRNRHMIGWSMLAIFFMVWRHPFGWLVLNLLLPSGAILEYSDL